MRLSKAALKRIAAGQLPLPTEEETQAVIVHGLRAHGFIVQVTTRRVKKCRRCGTHAHVGDGATKGIADLLVRSPQWCAGLWAGLEIKKPGPIKYSSVEQNVAHEVGDIVIVQSLEEALAAVRKIESEVVQC